MAEKFVPPVPPQYAKFEGNPTMVRCPYCGAEVGEQCSFAGRSGKREVLRNIRAHPSRFEAAGAEAIPTRQAPPPPPHLFVPPQGG
jgi:hypothetical protein